MRVERADLGPLKLLGEGAFAKVYHAPEFHLPGDPRRSPSKSSPGRWPNRAGQLKTRFRSATGSAQPTGPTSTGSRPGRARSSRIKARWPAC